MYGIKAGQYRSPCLDERIPLYIRKCAICVRRIDNDVALQDLIICCLIALCSNRNLYSDGMSAFLLQYARQDHAAVSKVR